MLRVVTSSGRYVGGVLELRKVAKATNHHDAVKRNIKKRYLEEVVGGVDETLRLVAQACEVG